MYLKSLTLKGFKSFADKSVITVEPGVTCIVGPNGAGKSNITDAILWVFGEQSAKSLRGTTMEDVIFSGSSARRGVGVAEVDLVLDNSDQVIPLEFSEITFTRRMYRSGESEYLINKTPARLLDIVDLLHDSGLGREAHSIISQGRIDEVLKSKPEQRRALIEEVAGTLKHKRRREKAIRKLDALDTHLQRARDIVREIDRQLRPMQRQAARAQKHKATTSALRELEVAIAVDDLRLLQGQWEAILTKEKEAEAEIDLMSYRLASQEEELERFQLLLEEKGLFVGDLSEQRRRASELLQRVSGLIALIGEKDKNIASKRDEMSRQIADARARIDQARAQVRDLSAQRSETEGQLKALYAQLSEYRKESEALKKARTGLDESIARLRNMQHTEQAQADRATVNRTAIDQVISSLDTQKAMLDERLSSVKASLESGADTLREKRAQHEELANVLARVRQEITLAESDINKRTRVVEARKESFDKAREGLINARAELKGLEDLASAAQSVSPGNEEFYAKAERRRAFGGRISEQLIIDPAVESIVEMLLGSDLLGVFVTDTALANPLIQDARSTEQCDVSLVPLDGGRLDLVDSDAGVRITEFLSSEARYHNALLMLLGDTFLVDTFEEALDGFKKNSSVRYVTSDGVVVWPNGKISYGQGQISREGALYRNRRIAHLRERIPELEEQVAHFEEELAQAEEALLSSQHDAFEIGQRFAGLTGEHGSLVAEVARSEEAFQTLQNERELLSVRQSEIERDYEIAIREKESLDTEISQHQARASKSAEELRELEAQRESRFAEESRLLGLLNECQVEIAQVAERDSYMKRIHTQADDEVSRLEAVLANAEPHTRALETMRARVAPLNGLCTLLQEKAQKISDNLSDRAQFEQTDSVSLRDTIHAAQTAVRESQEGLVGRRESLSQIRVEKAQLEVRVNGAVRAIVDDHGVPIETALASDELIDRKLAEDEAMALRKKLTTLGAINPIAAREYEDLRSRRDFMAEQMDDLTEARRALSRVVAVIDKKMRERFLETFEAVDGHFQEVFSVLFPGGTARLILTDSDDVDSSGVEYIVQPRGKRVRKMSLLSGGENSLSALALLFAINRVRPCPFFVLDEVEAALDDSNLRRFIAFINTMRSSTQFLIVTHQRRTMEMADVLYGVSMQSDGVSRLVKQRLENAIELVGDDLVG